MTIGSIQSSIAFTTPEARVALLALESEEQQQAIDQQGVELARRRFVEHSAAEVAAMREEASDILTGALIQTGVLVAGAALQGYSLSRETAACNAADEKTWKTVGSIGASASQGLSPALEDALGQSPAAGDRADAKQAATAAQRAEWELSDRKSAVDRSRDDQRQATEWLQRLVEHDAASMTAVLSTLA
jgi:hypothetical protein